MIDLRSDTVTRPTPSMRQAMATAEVGDDVYGEDPTVRALEQEIAALLGKEAAVFTSTGTMANQLAIATQTRPGDEVIVGEGTHVVWNEGGAGAALAGVQCVLAGRNGFFTADEMDAAVKPLANWYPRTSLVCVENTLNRAGGRIFPQEKIVAIAERAKQRGLAMHLDGARLWNASAASGRPLAELGAPFDTVSVCFSKGLGAPVGSALVGSGAIIEAARRLRQRWGGGMRQSGILAAGARHAIAHHRERLPADHANARRFAERVSSVPGISVDASLVETNIVNIDVDTPAQAVSHRARELGLLIGPSTPLRLRAVTHLDVTAAQIDEAALILGRAMESCRNGRPA